MYRSNISHKTITNLQRRKKQRIFTVSVLSCNFVLDTPPRFCVPFRFADNNTTHTHTHTVRSFCTISCMKSRKDDRLPLAVLLLKSYWIDELCDVHALMAVMILLTSVRRSRAGSKQLDEAEHHDSSIFCVNVSCYDTSTARLLSLTVFDLFRQPSANIHCSNVPDL